MCSAIRRRTPRSGSRRPSVTGLGSAAGRPPAHVRSVILPCGPVPVSDSRSTPSSWPAAGRAASRGHVPRSRVPGPVPGLGRFGGSSARGLLGDRFGAVLADDDEDRSDRDDLALLDEDLRDLARRRRGDLDRRLVRLDLDERLVLGDLVALGHEPAGDLAFGQALAQVGELELVRHGGGIYRGRPTQASGGTIEDAQAALDPPERDRLLVARQLGRDLARARSRPGASAPRSRPRPRSGRARCRARARARAAAQARTTSSSSDSGRKRRPRPDHEDPRVLQRRHRRLAVAAACHRIVARSSSRRRRSLKRASLKHLRTPHHEPLVVERQVAAAGARSSWTGPAPRRLVQSC